MGRLIIMLVTLSCFNLFFVGGAQYTANLSKEEDDDIEIQLKLLNKPFIKTIQYGAIHDCVVIYKQLEFDHPLLKNHTIDFSIISTPSYYKVSGKNYSTISKSIDVLSKATVGPAGTIPIRRIIKEDLIRERLALQAMRAEKKNRPNTFLAIARTKPGRNKYAGGGCYLKVDNPKAVGQQYSADRIRLQVGPDSIEAGWRVDPALYGDSKTRLFIRTDAGTTHCFDIRCAGFIQTSPTYVLGGPLERISVPGGPAYPLRFYIKMKNGNWNLLVGDNATLVGYWPSHIFTRPASNLGNHVEWGGAAFSPPGTPLPPMGSGNHPIKSILWDGYVRSLEVLNESGHVNDNPNIEIYADNSKLYSVRDVGYVDASYGRVIFYGGPGHL